jgi:ketosteroid isomerase-like protein
VSPSWETINPAQVDPPFPVTAIGAGATAGRSPAVGRDTEHRRLGHALFDAIEQGDSAAVDACYTPGMTIWSNVTGQVSSREENLEGLVKGRSLHRRRRYNDRFINTFDDGFIARYTVDVVTHDGTRASLWGCLVAEVRDGRIAKLFEFLDSGKFTSRGRRAPAGESA